MVTERNWVWRGTPLISRSIGRVTSAGTAMAPRVKPFGVAARNASQPIWPPAPGRLAITKFAPGR